MHSNIIFKLREETKNTDKAFLLFWFLNQKDIPKIQFWKLEQLFYKWDKLKSLLDGIKEDGYIKYKVCGRNKRKGYKIELQDKLLNFVSKLNNKNQQKQNNRKQDDNKNNEIVKVDLDDD